MSELRNVLALHGQPGSGRSFDAVARWLGQLPFHAPDRPGWGSSPLAPRDLVAQASWAAELIDRPTVVVGYSFGAAIAALVATICSAVTGVVLVAPAVTRDALVWSDQLLAKPGVGHLAGSLIAAVAERSFPAALSSRARHAFLVEQRSLLDHIDQVEGALRRLEVPVVVIAGARDRVVPPRSALRILESVPHVRLLVSRGGHDQLAEEPAVIADAVRSLADGTRTRLA